MRSNSAFTSVETLGNLMLRSFRASMTAPATTRRAKRLLPAMLPVVRHRERTNQDPGASGV